MDLRAQHIFEALMDLPEHEQRERLAGLCGDDQALLKEVESLLNAHERAGAFLRSPTGPARFISDSRGTTETDEHPTTVNELPREGPGTRIGPYKLLQCIGEGGFGSVFLADQEQPLRRRVALKVIKLGMDTKAVIARFE